MSNPNPTAGQACSTQIDSQCGASMPWESVNQPGAYICQWDGHLVRVPADGTWHQQPAVNIVGLEPLYVTKISDNPFVTMTKARLVASNLNLPVNF